MKRSELKKAAKGNVRRHYWFFLFVCLVSAIIGSEFTGSLALVREQMTELSGDVKEGKGGIVETAGETFGLDFSSAYASDDSVMASIFSPTRGVLAETVNTLTSGKISLRIVQMVNSVIGSASITRTFLILLSFAVIAAFWIFVQNLFTVIVRRMILEGSVYEKVSPRRMMFLADSQRWFRASVVMAYKSLFHLLWSVTIIGGVIKYYSYWMVPYIVAENPNIGAKEAVTLSKAMMKGHKWECFKLEFSFLFWWVLGFLSFGLADLFYLNSYETATYCEYYGYIRKLAVEAKLSNRFNDRYLFEKADKTLLLEAYGKIETDIPVIPELHGFRKFCSNVLGIALYDDESEKLYRKAQRMKLNEERASLGRSALTYPVPLSPLYIPKVSTGTDNTGYLRRYSLISISLMFFIFSIGGWLWELSIHFISEGEFVNRGMLYGPWLLIYGGGGVLILTLLNKFRKNPTAEVVSIVLLCGVFEYLSSYFMELAHGARWWDYTGYFLNINGRICAESMLTFAVAGTVFVYILAPRLDNILSRIDKKTAVTVLLVLHIAVVSDFVYSSFIPNEGKGITDDAPKQEEIIPEDDGLSEIIIP